MSRRGTMKHGVLIDDRGELWPDDSLELAKRLGYSYFGGHLAAAAVRERGFIHVRQDEGGAHVSLSPGRFSLVCLAGAMQLLNELRPARIVARMISGGSSSYEMFPTIYDFVERAESVSEKGIDIRLSRVAVPRSTRNLHLPTFAIAHPLLSLWKRERGALSPESLRAIVTGSLLRRVILVRQPARSSRLIVEHFGAAITIMRPCEALLLAGHPMEDMYDSEYGAWILPGYAKTISASRLTLESMLADIRTPDAMTIRARYDRLLLPWRSTAGDRFVLCGSLLRDRSVLPTPHDIGDLV
jgi:hypothetical protein